MGVNVSPEMRNGVSASIVENRSVGLDSEGSFGEIGPELVVEHVDLQAPDDGGGGVDDDGLVELPEDVVEKERKTAVVIEVGVGDDHVPDPELLFERERPGQPAGVEGHGIVEKKAGEEALFDAPAGTANDPKFHDDGPELSGDSTSRAG